MYGDVVLVAQGWAYSDIRFRLELTGVDRVVPAQTIKAGISLAREQRPNVVFIESTLIGAREAVEALIAEGFDADTYEATWTSPPPGRLGPPSPPRLSGPPFRPGLILMVQAIAFRVVR